MVNKYTAIIYIRLNASMIKQKESWHAKQHTIGPLANFLSLSTPQVAGCMSDLVLSQQRHACGRNRSKKNLSSPCSKNCPVLPRRWVKNAEYKIPISPQFSSTESSLRQLHHRHQSVVTPSRIQLRTGIPGYSQATTQHPHHVGADRKTCIRPHPEGNQR